MCGIFALINSFQCYSEEYIYQEFMKGKNRGPEHSILQPEMNNYIIGFHRLAINGLNDESNQPLVLDNDLILICNGEIYNYKELFKEMNVKPNTNSDCEIILHLYKKYGIYHTLKLLDGVFGFILVDMRVSKNQPTIFIARDPFGVRPLYILSDESRNNPILGFSSEIKSLIGFKNPGLQIKHFHPGYYEEYINNKDEGYWMYNSSTRYNDIGFQSILNIQHPSYSLSNIYSNIIFYLKNAVFKRCSVSDRPIACLLSGGLDSSLICGLVCEYNRENNLPPPETFSIGIEDSEDLYFAQIVADHLKTKHTNIILKESDFIEAIPEVIYAIESYDTTTIRASIGNYLIGKYISQNSDAKVIMNGDGSDELCGGYMYFHYAPTNIDFDRECYRLLSDIHKYDVLRSDKCISSHGLEPRTPFLDRSFVNYYMCIPMHIRNHNIIGGMEKHLLREAFSKENYGLELLPNSILFRTKEAFSDGVSKQNRSLFEIINDYTKNIRHESILDSSYITPSTNEQKYYTSIFDKYYKSCGSIIDYYWMPKFVDAVDCSARTLDIYSSRNNNVKNI
jgi:asparagine synthase (glutamine-hydrolysing)